MDSKRRARLREALALISSARRIVDAVCDKEQDCMDNYPENLQQTDKYEKMERACDSLNAALDSLDEAAENIESAAA